MKIRLTGRQTWECERRRYALAARLSELTSRGQSDRAIWSLACSRRVEARGVSGGVTESKEYKEHSLLIESAAVPNPDHDDLIADSPVADSDSPNTFCTLNLEASRRTGIRR